MADNEAADRSSRTTPPQPLPSSQPLSSLVVTSDQRTTSAGATTTSTATGALTRDAGQCDPFELRVSPARNGRYGGRSADPRRLHEENFGSSCDVGERGDEDHDDGVVARRRTLARRPDSDGLNRYHRNGGAGDVGERSSPQGGAMKPPDQDGPLDFSVKRRGSMSESFTDDSRASSSASPTSFLGVTRASCPSPQVSPESDVIFALQHQQQQQRHSSGPSSHQFPMTSQHQSSGSRRGRLSCSDEAELVGQPRIVPPGTVGGSRSTSPSASLLSNGAHGKSAGATAAATAAALLNQNGAMLSPLNSLSQALMMDPRRVSGANGGKVQRPFKAYPKELLQMPLGYLGHPTLNPLLSLDPNVLSLSQEELMAVYWQQLDLVKERDKHLLTPGKASGGSPLSSNSSSTSSSSNGSINHNHINGGSGIPTPTVGLNHSHNPLTKDTSPQPPPPPLLAPPPLSLPSPHYTPNFVSSPSNSSSKTPSPNSVFGTGSGMHQFPPPSAPPLVSSTSSGSGGSGSRKRPRSLPDSQKDDAYWERRRKNNDAAKRSRDARRAKEDEIAIRAALLEQENLKLRVEVAALKTETARLRCMLYNS